MSKVHRNPIGSAPLKNLFCGSVWQLTQINSQWACRYVNNGNIQECEPLDLMAQMFKTHLSGVLVFDDEAGILAFLRESDPALEKARAYIRKVRHLNAGLVCTVDELRNLAVRVFGGLDRDVSIKDRALQLFDARVLGSGNYFPDSGIFALGSVAAGNWCPQGVVQGGVPLWEMHRALERERAFGAALCRRAQDVLETQLIELTNENYTSIRLKEFHPNTRLFIVPVNKKIEAIETKLPSDAQLFHRWNFIEPVPEPQYENQWVHLLQMPIPASDYCCFENPVKATRTAPIDVAFSAGGLL